MASKVNTKHSKMLLWIPDGMDANDKTLEIANAMKSKFKMTEIDKDDYNNNFYYFYENNMKGYNDANNDESFCKAKGKTGVKIIIAVQPEDIYPEIECWSQKPEDSKFPFTGTLINHSDYPLSKES